MLFVKNGPFSGRRRCRPARPFFAPPLARHLTLSHLYHPRSCLRIFHSYTLFFPLALRSSSLFVPHFIFSHPSAILNVTLRTVLPPITLHPVLLTLPPTKASSPPHQYVPLVPRKHASRRVPHAQTNTKENASGPEKHKILYRIWWEVNRSQKGGKLFYRAENGDIQENEKEEDIGK